MAEFVYDKWQFIVDFFGDYLLLFEVAILVFGGALVGFFCARSAYRSAVKRRDNLLATTEFRARRSLRRARGRTTNVTRELERNTRKLRITARAARE